MVRCLDCERLLRGCCTWRRTTNLWAIRLWLLNTAMVLVVVQRATQSKDSTILKGNSCETRNLERPKTLGFHCPEDAPPGNMAGGAWLASLRQDL